MSGCMQIFRKRKFDLHGVTKYWTMITTISWCSSYDKFRPFITFDMLITHGVTKYWTMIMCISLCYRYDKFGPFISFNMLEMPETVVLA
jgi:hypothetical protein